MIKYNFFKIAACALSIIFFAEISRVDAVPAFARKYQISCQVCHSPVMPRLKGFGDDFAGNGFRMTDYQSPRFFIPTGDEQLSLFRELPLAIRMDAFASFNFNNTESVDIAAPFVLKIISGGELSEKLSYYFYFLLNERGSIAGIEDAFLVYQDLAGSGINFYIGQFSVSDPLFKGELRYTVEPYKIYGTKPGNSVADLKYDKGIILEKDLPTGTTLVGQVVNGNGIGEAGEGWVFDNDKYKNFMLRINQSIGKSVSIGVFGYSGKESLTDPGMLLGGITNKIQMYGPDLVLNFDEKLHLNIQYLRRTDSQVFASGGGVTYMDVTTQGGFAEVIYSPKRDMSKWYLTGLVNWVDSNLGALDYTSATLHAGYLLRRNVRLVTEYTQVIVPDSYGKVNIGFVSAF